MPAPAPLLADPADVTVEWLTAALHGSGAAPAGATVVGFDPELIGTGKVGRNVRFRLEWSGADPDAGEVPAAVVGKFASDDPTSRQAGLLTGTYVREVAFYRELAPRCLMRVPHCLVAEIEMATGEFVLLFEDISPARAGDNITGCTPDEAALAMEQLALLHAGFWDDATLFGRPWLVRRAQESGEGLAAMYGALVGAFLTQYDERLSDPTRDAAERFTPNVLAWLAHDVEPFTLLHGDYRLENMLFGTGPGAPPLTVVDWQTPSIGPGPSDVAYFLGAGLSVEDRRAHERDLVEIYRAGLAAAGIERSGDEVWHGYRAGAFTGLHMTVVASVLVGRDPRSDEMFLTMVERHAAHVHDLDAFGLLG